MILAKNWKFGTNLREQLEAKLYAPRRVMLVDDHDNYRKVMGQLIISTFNVVLSSYSTVLQAEDSIRKGNYFHAAILDYRFTNGTGIDLYRIIMNLSPYTNVIFITGMNDLEVQRKVEQTGPARVYTKDSMHDLDFVRRLFLQLGIRPLPAQSNEEGASGQVQA